MDPKAPAMDPKGAVVLTLLLALAVHDEDSALQVDAWVNYDRDAGIIVFMQVAAACCAFGLVTQTLWLKFVNTTMLSANNFVQLCLSVLFGYNWVYLLFVGSPTPLSIGFQSGACAGYELYSTISEVWMFISGEQKRVDMLVHHGLCIVFIAATLYIYPRVPVGDLFYWHLVWDSISRTLVSNFPLNFRYFFMGIPNATNAFFFCTFLWVRGVEQVKFVKIMSERPFTDIESRITWVVVAGWVALTALNAWWGLKIVQIALKIGKKKKKEA